MELVNEWFQNGKLKIFDTHFRIYYTYEKEIMAALILTVNSICKVEMEYHGKIGHTLGHIEHIGVMIIIGIFYKDWHLANQTVAPTIHGFEGLNLCIKYLDSQPHKPIFYASNYFDG